MVGSRSAAPATDNFPRVHYPHGVSHRVYHRTITHVPKRFVSWSRIGGSVAAKVVIGVLTWRGYDATRACLESLRLLEEWPLPTVVVDSASGTGEGIRLATEFGPSVQALTLDENGGVPAGYNAAIGWAARRGASHVLLLNNDVVITDADLVQRLLAAADSDVAAVGPIVHDADGTVYSAGGLIDWTRGRSSHRTIPVRRDRAYEAEWLDGPCLLVSIPAAIRIGGLEPTYFMYWEELDWCVRARTHGFRCLLQPTTSIVHLRGARKRTMDIRYLLLRNGILFMRRNGTLHQNLTSLVWAAGYLSVGLVVKRVRTPRAVPAAIGVVWRAFAWNVRDAIRRRRWRLPADGPSLSAVDVDEPP